MFITDKIETSHGKLCVFAFQQKNGRNHLSIPTVLQMEFRKLISHIYKQIMQN